jgi:NAD(P)-dependent dehydrogenase (short-subunit alcohol dehydrogenase family)
VAEEVRMAGITANAILPSIIDTPVNRKAIIDADRTRWVKPESIASLAVWLCSDGAADVNGALIPVYGRV